MRTFRRSALAVLLALTLSASWASAAEPRSQGPRGGPTGEQGLSGAFGRLWGALVSLWSEAGCQIDPLGLCSPASPEVAPADAGCEIDPLGLCSPNGPQGLTAGDQQAAPADEGCELDPLG